MEAEEAPYLLLLLLRSNPANAVVRLHRAPAAVAPRSVVTTPDEPCPGADAADRQEAAPEEEEEDDDDEGLTRRGQDAAAR